MQFFSIACYTFQNNLYGTISSGSGINVNFMKYTIARLYRIILTIILDFWSNLIMLLGIKIKMKTWKYCAMRVNTVPAPKSCKTIPT